MKQQNSQAVMALSRTFMQGAVERRNANGNYMGQVLSYISSAPAGDVRKELAKTGLKGKALRAKVQQVIRGEKHMAWAIHEAQDSVARSMGYVPIKTQTNKDQSVLTTRYELIPQSHEEQRQAIIESLSDAELLALIEARKKADAEAKSNGEANAAKLTGEAPAVEVKSEVVSA